MTDDEILALNAGEVFFSETPTRFPEAGHGTQYHAGAPGVIKFARAILQAATRDTPSAQTDWQHRCAVLVDIYDDARNNAPENRCYVDGAFTEEMDEVRALCLAASAPKGDGND